MLIFNNTNNIPDFLGGLEPYSPGATDGTTGANSTRVIAHVWKPNSENQQSTDWINIGENVYNPILLPDREIIDQGDGTSIVRVGDAYLKNATTPLEDFSNSFTQLKETFTNFFKNIFNFFK